MRDNKVKLMLYLAYQRFPDINLDYLRAIIEYLYSFDRLSSLDINRKVYKLGLTKPLSVWLVGNYLNLESASSGGHEDEEL